MGVCYSFGMDWIDPKILQKGMCILAFVVLWNFVLGFIEGVRARRRPSGDEIRRQALEESVLRRRREESIPVESRWID